MSIAEPLGAPIGVAAPAGSQRLLAGLGPGATDLARHREIYPEPFRSKRARPELIDVVERSGLRGRGGGAFPTGAKLRAVAAGRRRPVVVINGAEGEPLSRKDAHLLAHAPHLVLDGAVLAAGLVGADDVHVSVDHLAGDALDAVDRAILARRSAGEVLGGACSLRPVPSHYVAGEETALVRHLDGGEAIPTGLTIKPFQKGLRGRPTLVLNVETAAHLAQVLLWGADWFREQGTTDHPGTALATVAGGIARPGVLEVPLGITLAELAGRAGGSPVKPKAVLLGGYFGSWVPARTAAGLPFANETLRPHGAAVGCGAVALLPEDACGVCESSRVLSWMAGQTAGQCGPCVHGLAAVADGFAALARGRGDVRTVDRLHRWAAQIDGRGACRFPDGVLRLLRSALDVFDDDVRRHLAHETCPPQAPILPTPPVPVR